MIYQKRLLVLAFFAISVSSTFGQSNKNYITWNNGDALTGKLTGAKQESLFWESDLFKGQLELRLDVLNNIRFATKNLPKISSEKYFVRMVDGNRVFGDITKIDDQFVYIASPRHKNLKISKSSVHNIVHLKNAGFVMLGPNNLESWGSISNSKRYWKINDTGQLSASRNDANIFYETKLPDAVQIELEVSWKKKLDFIFGFGVPASKRSIQNLARIESWEDSIVLVHPDDFEPVIESLSRKQKRLKLLINWDRKNNQIFVNDEDGKQLCKAKLPAMDHRVKSGFYIENKKDYLTVETMRVSKAAAGFNPSSLGVQSTDGKVVTGGIESFDGKTWTMKSGDETELPDTKFRSANLNPMKKATSPKNEVVVRYLDGTLVKGTLDSIQSNIAKLKTTFSNELVSADLKEAIQIRIGTQPVASSTKSVNAKQVLFLEGATIQGELVGGTGKIGDVLRWQPVGSKTALPLGDGNLKIRFNQTKHTTKPASEWPDTIYFVNRDVIPCRIVSIDEHEVRFESFTENKIVPADTVKAIDFSPLRTFAKINCDDPGWFFSERGKNKTDIGKNEMTVRDSCQFGHGQLSSAKLLTFEMQWKSNSYSRLQCKLFVGNVKNPRGGIPVHMMLYNSRIYFMEQNNRFGGRTQQIQVPNNKAKMSFEIDRQNLKIKVNGTLAKTIKLDGKLIRGRGMTFSVTAFAGNRKPHLTLKDFVVNNQSAGATPIIVDETKRDLLLTIPRIRKDNPSTHILCAKNGDLLRGRLKILDKNLVKFESRLDDFSFKREIVSSLVWIHAPKKQDGDEEPPEIDLSPKKSISDADQIVQVVLNGGQRITLAAKAWKDQKLEGVSETLGKCSIPLSEILEIRQGKLAVEAKDIAYADWVATHAKEPKLDDGTQTETESPLVGTAAADFELKLLDGSKFKLSDHRGKVVVLDFWASWCGPCIRGMPEVITATGSFKPEEVVFVAVNLLEKPENIKPFVKSQKWDATIALDADGSISEKYGASDIPHTVIIDKKGKIVFVKTGGSNDLRNILINNIRKALGKEPIELKKPDKKKVDI